MNEQLQTLLSESRNHLRRRQLKKALNTAQIALEFGMNESADKRDLIQANLLLATTFHINGRYQNEPASFQKALSYLEDARNLNDLVEDKALWMNIYLTSGKLNISLQDFGKAINCLTKCRLIAEELDDLSGIVFSRTHISEAYIEKGDLDKAIELSEETLAFLQKNASSIHFRLWAEAYLQLSQAYILRKDYSRSLEMSQQLLEVSRSAGDIEKEVVALRNIAVVCGVKSNYKIGMQYFLEALTKCESIGYRELTVQLQVNIGTIYAHLYNYPEAIRRYQMVLDEHGDVLEDKSKVVIFNNLGNIYLTTDHPALALQHFENALALAETFQFQEMIVHSLTQLSRTKLQLNRLQEAVQEAEWAEQLFAQLGEVNGRQINLLNLAEIAFRRNEHDRSIKLAEDAIAAAREMKDDACEIRGYKHLAKSFKAMGQYQKALEYEEKYGEIQEAFAKVQRSRQFLDLEIRHAIREKEKEIEQLTRDNELKALLLQKSDQISRQNEELTRANEDLKQFAYVASHDLKEPLRMIGSYTQLIEKQVGSHLDEPGREYFSYISEGVRRMYELLDGLLKYATVGSNERELEKVDLNSTVLVSIANLRASIEETNAAIEQDFLPAVKGHQELMVQLFQNLISNALKFKKKGENPQIRISGYETDSEQTFFVRDNGIGISPRDQQKIFEIFQRLHSRQTYDGTGIGLAICQKIAQRMNGRIWVESEEGNGATFFVAMPK